MPHFDQINRSKQIVINFRSIIPFYCYVQDDDGPNRIHESDRVAIKQFIVTLMLKSSPTIQKQLSDAVSIIGKYDFPDKWPQLISEMVDKFASGDFRIINGVLQTAHSIFKRYRYEFKSQALWVEIKFVLDSFAKPLTDLLVATMALTKTHENNGEVLPILYDSIVLMTKVFYSLNAQDLPEFFEDNMETWMNAFHELLVTDVACLRTGVSTFSHSSTRKRLYILRSLGSISGGQRCGRSGSTSFASLLQSGFVCTKVR